MGRKSLGDYFELNEMPTGRWLFALRGASEELDALEIGSLREAAEGAREVGRSVLDLEMRWETFKGKSRARGDARKFKLEIVRLLGGVHAVCQARAEGPVDDPRVAAAETLLETCFPSGLRGVVEQPYEVFLGTVRTLVRGWRGALSEQVVALGLGPDVDHIAARLDSLDSELRPGVAGGVDYEDVQAAREGLHEAGCALLSRVIAHFALAGDGAEVEREAAATRERVLAELNRQQRLVAETRSRHRPVLDVDPETGVEVDPDVVVTPTPETDVVADP